MIPTRLHSLDKEEVLNFLYLRVGISGTRLSRKLRHGVWGAQEEMKSHVCRSTMYVLFSGNNFVQDTIIITVAYFKKQFTCVKLMRFIVIRKDVCLLTCSDIFDSFWHCEFVVTHFHSLMNPSGDFNLHPIKLIVPACAAILIAFCACKWSLYLVLLRSFRGKFYPNYLRCWLICIKG